MATEKQLIYKDDVIKMAWLDNECEVVTLSDIENMEPANAVEVIRCKDCVVWKRREDGLINCPYCTDLKQDDDFCSYGERKNDG